MNTVTQIMFLLLVIDTPTSVSIDSAWVTRPQCEEQAVVVRKDYPHMEFYCSRSTIILHEVKPPKGARAHV